MALIGGVGIAMKSVLTGKIIEKKKIYIQISII